CTHWLASADVPADSVITMKCSSPCRLFSSTRTSTSQLYTLSLHDALPISIADRGRRSHPSRDRVFRHRRGRRRRASTVTEHPIRSEEHTSELQSRGHLVCRLLLEKKK